MKSLPQNLFVFLILVGILVLIFTVQKPHSVCDSQQEVFKLNQTPFLYLDPKKNTKKTDLEKFVDFCKSTNSPGGCLDFFEGMRKLHTDLENAPSGCTEGLANLPEVQSAIFTALELMVHLAWGTKPPMTSFERNGWLDSSQVAVFCDFKKLINANMGSDKWKAFVEQQMSSLPGASLLPRNDMWSRTLLSDPCANY